MPAKTLPKRLVQRLTRASKVINKYLGSMKNIDPRRNDDARTKLWKVDSKDTENYWGGRVRQMNVKRNYPELELVIKKSHHKPGAKNELIEIENRIDWHDWYVNKPNVNALNSYVLRKPIAYAIGNGLIAMAKTNKPTLNEVLGHVKGLSLEIIEPPATSRGKQFFRKLSKKHKFTKKQLAAATIQVCKLMHMNPRNILFLGVNKKGKFIFMPLVDLY